MLVLAEPDTAGTLGEESQIHEHYLQSLAWGYIDENKMAALMGVIKEIVNSTDYVPNQITEAANTIFKISSGINWLQNHKEGFERIMGRASILVVVLWQSYKKSKYQSLWPPPTLRKIVDYLVETVHLIYELLERKFNAVKRIFWGYVILDLGKIKKYNRRLESVAEDLEKSPNDIKINILLLEVLHSRAQHRDDTDLSEQLARDDSLDKEDTQRKTIIQELSNERSNSQRKAKALEKIKDEDVQNRSENKGKRKRIVVDEEDVEGETDGEDFWPKKAGPSKARHRLSQVPEDEESTDDEGLWKKKKPATTPKQKMRWHTAPAQLPIPGISTNNYGSETMYNKDSGDTYYSALSNVGDNNSKNFPPPTKREGVSRELTYESKAEEYTTSEDSSGDVSDPPINQFAERGATIRELTADNMKFAGQSGDSKRNISDKATLRSDDKGHEDGERIPVDDPVVGKGVSMKMRHVRTPPSSITVSNQRDIMNNENVGGIIFDMGNKRVLSQTAPIPPQSYTISNYSFENQVPGTIGTMRNIYVGNFEKTVGEDVESASESGQSSWTNTVAQLKRPTQADEDGESHADVSVTTAQDLVALTKSLGEAKLSESTEPSVFAAITRRVNPASPTSDRTKMVTPPSPTLTLPPIEFELPSSLPHLSDDPDLSTSHSEIPFEDFPPYESLEKYIHNSLEPNIGDQVVPPTSVQQVFKSPHDGKQYIEELGSPPALAEDLPPPNDSAGVSWSQSCHCITAETALVHVLNFTTQLLAAFTEVGFKGEYRIQVGFNQSVLHAGMLVEEISLFLDEDLQVSEDDACTTFSAVFAPFPGVVYTPGQTHSILVDPPTGNVLTMQDPVGRTLATAANSGITGSGGTSRGVEANSSYSGHAAKIKTDEKHQARGGGGSGGQDDEDSDDSPHGSPKVPGGDLPTGNQFGIRHLDIGFSSTLSITTGGSVSHEIETASDVSIEVNENYRKNNHPPNSKWSGPWLQIKLTTIRLAARPIPINQPAYVLSLAQVQIAACSPSEMKLSSQEPKDLHFWGNSAKRSDSKSKQADIKFTAAANPNATVGYSTGMGSSTERTLGEWDVSTDTLTMPDALRLKISRNDSSAGAWWRYIHNDELFDHIPKANFENDLCPSAVFTLDEVSTRLKVEFKVLVFWVNRPQAQAAQSVWKKIWKRSDSEKTRMPIFSNFVYQVTVVLDDLEKVRDDYSWRTIGNTADRLDMTNFSASKNPEPIIPFDGVTAVLKTRNKTMETVFTDAQISMTSVIQGKAELTTAEKAGWAPIKIREPLAASEPSTLGLPTPSLTPSPEVRQARVEQTDTQDTDTVDTDVKSIALAPSDQAIS